MMLSGLRKTAIKIRGVAFWFCTLLAVLCVYSAAQGQYRYESKGRRDPFIALVTSDGRLLKLDVEEKTKTVLVVEGIIFDKNGISYAIVNGAVVKVGDRIDEFQVLRVENDKVTFIKEGQAQEIVIKKEEE